MDLAHDRPAGDQLSEPFLMSKRVTGTADRPLAPSNGRTASNYSDGRLFLDHSDLLLQANFVSESWACVHLVELLRKNWNQDDDDGQKKSEPEVRRLHQRSGDPCVRVNKCTIRTVEDQREYEVEDDATPNDKVIESSPVVSIQTTLK